MKKNLGVKDDLLFMNNKLVVPAAIRGTFSSLLHKTHPDEFKMKLLAEYIWSSKIFWKIQNHGKTRNQSLIVGKNLKILLEVDHTTKLRTLSFANQ